MKISIKAVCVVALVAVAVAAVLLIILQALAADSRRAWTTTDTRLGKFQLAAQLETKRGQRLEANSVLQYLASRYEFPDTDLVDAWDREFIVKLEDGIMEARSYGADGVMSSDDMVVVLWHE